VSTTTIAQIFCFLPLLYPLFAARLVAIAGVGLLCLVVVWLLGISSLAAGGLWLATLLLAMRSAMVARRDERQRRLQDAMEAFTFTGPRQAASQHLVRPNQTMVGVRLGNSLSVNPDVT